MNNIQSSRQINKNDRFTDCVEKKVYYCTVVCLLFETVSQWHKKMRLVLFPENGQNWLQSGSFEVLKSKTNKSTPL